MMSYNGPLITNQDLSRSEIIRVMLKLDQTVDSEKDEDKKCRNYPNKQYSHYQECDKKNVYVDCLKRYPFMPFGVALYENEITEEPM